MFDRALAEPRLSHLGESLETARRLYGVGNYVYCRDLVGYLLQQHPDVADAGVLRGIFDELEGLALGPAAAADEPTGGSEGGPTDPDQPSDAGDEEPDEDEETTGEFDLPRRGARAVHTLGSGARISPRSRPSGHFGGAAARPPTPPPEEAAPPAQETPVVRAIDPRPAPTPPPRRTMTPPEPSVEVEGRQVLPQWRPPPSPARRELPAPAPRPAPPTPLAPPRAEIVRYEERPVAATVIEGAPGRVAFAFGAGILLGALAVVVLMEHYQSTVRARYPAIATRPVIIRTPAPPPIYLPPPPAPAPPPPVVAAVAPPPVNEAQAVLAVAATAEPAPAPVPKAKPRPKQSRRPKARTAPKASGARTSPPPTTEGRIVVETRPASRGKVTVKVDGKERGTAPLSVKIKPGVHEIQTLQGAGYPELRMVRVEPGGLARVVVPLAK